jgi:hypothetical protein
MKPRAFAAAAAGILLSIGTAFAFHPMDRNVRGQLEQDQRDRIEMEDVQRGVFRGAPSLSARAAARQPTRAARRGEYANPPYLTEHHTR